jgi:hypothetical protein
MFMLNPFWKVNKSIKRTKIRILNRYGCATGWSRNVEA